MPMARDDSVMEEARTPVAEARVLSLIDASRHSLAALSAAVDLASQWRLELVGLFVEDAALLESAGFSFAREVGAQSGLARPLSSESFQASLARHAQRAERALTEAVAGHDVRHRLQVSRGGVVSEALAIIAPGDLLMLGKAGFSGRWGARLGSTSRALVLQAPCTVVIWDDRRPMHPGPLHYLGPTPPEREALLERFRGLSDRIEPLPEMGGEALVSVLARARTGALMLDRVTLAALTREDPDLLARVPVPVFVLP